MLIARAKAFFTIEEASDLAFLCPRGTNTGTDTRTRLRIVFRSGGDTNVAMIVSVPYYMNKDRVG